MLKKHIGGDAVSYPDDLIRLLRGLPQGLSGISSSLLGATQSLDSQKPLAFSPESPDDCVQAHGSAPTCNQFELGRR